MESTSHTLSLFAARVLHRVDVVGVDIYEQDGILAPCQGGQYHAPT